MQTCLDIDQLNPIGTNILVKRPPTETQVGRFVIPEAYRDEREKEKHLYTGIVIAAGSKTKAARFGHDRGVMEPGDLVWFWNRWNWNDHEVVIKDEKTGDQYLMVDESDVAAFKVLED